MVSPAIQYTIGQYLAVVGILLIVLYASWYVVKDRITSKRWTLRTFYIGVTGLFACMVYGFMQRSWWLFIGAIILQAFWMAWIRKRLEDGDKDDSHGSRAQAGTVFTPEESGKRRRYPCVWLGIVWLRAPGGIAIGSGVGLKDATDGFEIGTI